MSSVSSMRWDEGVLGNKGQDRPWARCYVGAPRPLDGVVS